MGHKFSLIIFPVTDAVYASLSRNEVINTNVEMDEYRSIGLYSANQLLDSMEMEWTELRNI